MKIALLTFVLPFLTLAAETKKAGTACGIEVMVPGNWTVTEAAQLKAPVCFEMTALQEVSVAVLKSSESKLSCADFLKNMDESRKKKNVLASDKQKMSEAQVKNAKADQGALGEYEIQEAKMKFAVKQKSYCLKNGNETRVLLATFQKNKGAQYEPLISEIFTTFKFTK